GVFRRLDAKSFEQGDVFGGIAQVVFAPDDVGDAHLQIVHHVHQMEDRLAVGANDDKIRVDLLTVGQFPAHLTDDEVRDNYGLAGHAELNGTLLLVSQTTG